MSEDVNFLAGQSSIWVQVDGPNTKPQYLGCHGIGDITEPLGDETTLFCPDPAAAGAYVSKNSFTGEPGSVTTSIVTDMRRISDYLEDLGKCKVPIFLHKVSCGRRDVFSNYDRSFILRGAKVTQRAIGNAASRTPGDENETTQTFDIAALALDRIFNLGPSRMTVAETEDITGISACAEDRCEGTCGASQKATDLMFAATKALSASAGNRANVLKSVNSGSFSAVAADPFAGGEDIQGVVCFKVGRNTTRVIVARGTTDGGNPAEVAYSDTDGAAWTNVDVGSTNGEFVSNSHALFAIDRYHIWLGTNLGKIYFSNDGGLSWTLQTNPAVSATPITGVSFYSPTIGYAVHTGGQVDKTTDGGSSWGAATVSGSAAATDIHAISAYFVWVVGTDGKFYTHDGAVTWATRDVVPTAAIDFVNELEGIAVGSAASGVIYETIDGGYDWSAIPLQANSGFWDVLMMSPKLAYVTGKANSGTGMLIKVTPLP